MPDWTESISVKELVFKEELPTGELLTMARHPVNPSALELRKNHKEIIGFVWRFRKEHVWLELHFSAVSTIKLFSPELHSASRPGSACCLATFLLALPAPAAQENWCCSQGQFCRCATAAPAETSGEEEGVEVNCEGCYRQDYIKISKARAALLSNSSLLPQAEVIRGRARGQARLSVCSQRQLKLLKDNIEVVSSQLSAAAPELHSDSKDNLKSHRLVLLFKGHIGSHIIWGS